MKKKEYGAITVEAVTTLFIFLMFFVMLLRMMTIIRTQVIIQSAICETAKELSTYSYVLSKAGYFDLRTQVSASAEEHNNLAELNKNYKSLVTTISDGGAISFDDFSAIIDILENLDVKDFTAPALNNVAENGSNKIAGLAARQLIKKYLQDGAGNTDYLEKAGVENGIEGLDFSLSHYPQSEGDELRITVTYKVKIVSIPFFEDISFDRKIALNATTRVWGN